MNSVAAIAPRRRTSSVARAVAATIGLGTAVLTAHAAHAQYSPALAPRERAAQAGKTEGGLRTAQTVGLFFAPFTVEDSGGVGTAFGGLLSYEIAFVPERGRPWALGAWYFNDGDGDLVEFHGKTFFNDQWGIQLGVLTSPRGFQTIGEAVAGPGGEVTYESKTERGVLYDAFALYNLTPPNSARNYWNFQAGAGVFVDTTGGRTTADFTGFLQGDTSLSQKLKLMATYWYVSDRGHLNRFGLGLGYNF